MRLFALALLAVSAAACSAPADVPDEQDPTASEEADLTGDNDWSEYAPTDGELAGAPAAQPLDDELTLFAIPAPKVISLSWNTPGGLARRTLLNEGLGLSRALGHAIVRVSCDKGASHFQGSVVDTGDDFKRMVLKEKAGLGVLFRTVPGALEPEADGQETIDKRYGNGRISFIRFAIAKDTCHELLDYAKAFDQAKVASQYGFVRPLYREGSGCSAFSMAFLELAGLDEQRFRNAWSFDVRVPSSLIGDTSVLQLLFTFRPWASETEPHQRLVGWDPTKMFKTIREFARSGSEKTEKRGRAIGIVLDRRSVKPRSELANRTFWAGAPNAPRNWWGFGDP